MKKILAIGRSHTICMVEANRLGMLEKLCSFSVIKTSFFEPCFSQKNGESQPSNELKELVERKLNDGVDAVVLIVQGNRHSVIALPRLNPRIGFVDPETSSPISFDTTGRNLIPSSLISWWHRSNLIELSGFIELISQLSNVPIFVMGPPPPIQSEEEVLSRLDRYFTEKQTDKVEVECAEFRRISWLLMTREYRRITEKFQKNATFIELEDSFLEDGFLAEPFWGQSATHANPIYGKARIEQVLNELETENEPV